MENTERVLFEDDSPRWYVAVGEGWVGPLTPSDVYEKVIRQELSWAHYVSKDGQSDWKRICDTPEFQVAVPQQPGRQLSKTLQAQIREAKSEQTQPSFGKLAKGAAPAVRQAEGGWFLHYNDTQFGPFARDEVARFIRIGKVHGRVYGWRNGMDGWERLDRLPAFNEVFAEVKKTLEKMPPTFAGESPQVDRDEDEQPRSKSKAESAKAESPKERRSGLRSPLVAKIILARGESVSVAVCRDISVGGMQVLTEEPPGRVGARVKLNVSMPAAKASGPKSAAKIEPFVAEGEIVRILEDGRGFSFRFEKLSDAARRAIERYIESP